MTTTTEQHAAATGRTLAQALSVRGGSLSYRVRDGFDHVLAAVVAAGDHDATVGLAEIVDEFDRLDRRIGQIQADMDRAVRTALDTAHNCPMHGEQLREADELVNRWHAEAAQAVEARHDAIGQMQHVELIIEKIRDDIRGGHPPKLEPVLATLERAVARPGRRRS